MFGYRIRCGCNSGYDWLSLKDNSTALVHGFQFCFGGYGVRCNSLLIMAEIDPENLSETRTEDNDDVIEAVEVVDQLSISDKLKSFDPQEHILHPFVCAEYKTTETSEDVRQRILSGEYSLRSKMKGKSAVWAKFCEILDSNKQLVKQFVACGVCQKVYSYTHKTGTSNLLKHKCPVALSTLVVSVYKNAC